ncbi:MAG: glucosamine-6-phosphate deaminase [Sphaerochaeta sp.]|nr:glucosamine-6-phosphate deaminase [Sphaerochaeta sp.]
MNIQIYHTKQELGSAAAISGADVIKQAIQKKNRANIILATGASQFEMLEQLKNIGGIDWSKVHAFHLDEYVGVSQNHPASFRKYLKERFVDFVPELASFTFIEGDSTDIEKECSRISKLISRHQIDVAFVGIGENGHLAFNDPPADFNTQVPYLVVNLDLDCRKQQLGEGWFPSIDNVPQQAISMSIKQIMKSKVLIVSVPEARKAKAVHCAVKGPVSNLCPSSILQNHPDCRLYLDQQSAALL